MATLNDRQLNVLRTLAFIRLESKWSRKAELDGVVTHGWAQPMEFGGTNGSHHSATATALAKLGLVDRYKYGCSHYPCVNNFKCRAKGACWYRISDKGLDAIKEPTP